jgi:hypothetical protein
VLNLAATRGPDGALYLFPRLAGPGNYSRVGRVRVVFDERGHPVDVERRNYALEPRETYEQHGDSGGCEAVRCYHVCAGRVYACRMRFGVTWMLVACDRNDRPSAAPGS